MLKLKRDQLFRRPGRVGMNLDDLIKEQGYQVYAGTALMLAGLRQVRLLVVMVAD